MKITFLVLLSLLSVLLVAPAAIGVTCNPAALSPCLAAFAGSPPTGNCCSLLRAQAPCFCQYSKNPALSPYINSPVAQKVAATCGVPKPHC